MKDAMQGQEKNSHKDTKIPRPTDQCTLGVFFIYRVEMPNQL